jgi:hypothetical protein
MQTEEQMEKAGKAGHEFQKSCVNHCYKDYKNGSFNYMFNECSQYRNGIEEGSQRPMDLCWIFQNILNDVRNARAGRRLEQGITFSGALQEIAILGLEDIPEEAYKGVAAD